MTHFYFFEKPTSRQDEIIKDRRSENFSEKSLLMDVTLLLNFTFYYWEQYQI